MQIKKDEIIQTLFKILSFARTHIFTKTHILRAQFYGIYQKKLITNC